MYDAEANQKKKNDNKKKKQTDSENYIHQIKAALFFQNAWVGSDFKDLNICSQASKRLFFSIICPVYMSKLLFTAKVGHVFENVNTYQGNNHLGSFDSWNIFVCQVISMWCDWQVCTVPRKCFFFCYGNYCFVCLWCFSNSVVQYNHKKTPFYSMTFDYGHYLLVDLTSENKFVF